MRPRVLRAFGISLLLVTGIAQAALGDAPAPARRANAHKLVRMASDACGEALRALAATESRGPQLLPLHDALARMQSSLFDVGARLEARDVRFLQALRAGTRTLAELRVVRSRSGLQGAQAAALDGQIGALSSLYARLRNRYGREWLRYTAGRPLDEQERRSFAQVQAVQALFVATLNPLLERARSQGDPRTVHDLSLLVDQASSIAQAPATLDEALNASILTDTIEGEYAATRDAHPADDPEWHDADQVVEQIQTDASVGFVFTTNLDAVEKWSWVEDETDVPDAPAAVAGPAYAPGVPDALGEALARRPRTEAPLAGEDEPEMSDGETEAFDEQEDETAEMESPVDSAAVLVLPADPENPEDTAAAGAGKDTTEAPAAPGAPDAADAADAAECTAESAAQGCAGPLLPAPAAVQPPPSPACTVPPPGRS